MRQVLGVGFHFASWAHRLPKVRVGTKKRNGIMRGAI